MALSTEQQAKLKEHVKNKLIEIGAYVDDQLSDYVMIMVNSKKNEKQMVEDLDLFLGGTEAAVKFVDWLNAESKRVSDKASSSSSKPKSAVTRKSSASAAHESDELAIQVEADEFSEDFDDSAKSRQKKPTAEPAAKKHTSEPETPAPEQQDTAAAKKTPSTLQSRVGAVIRREESSSSHHRHHRDEHDDRDRDRDDHDERDDDRRKRKLSSSVSSAPLSSVVKVSEQRKYAVPRSMQPNKSILLKAVNAANSSVGSSSSQPAKSIADLKLEELRAKRKSLPDEPAAAAETEQTGAKRLRSSGPYETADRRKAVIDENSDSLKDMRKVQIESGSSALKALDTNNQSEPKFIVTLNGLEEEKQQQVVRSTKAASGGLFANRLGPVNHVDDEDDDDMLDGDVITAGEEMDLLDEELGEHDEERMDNETADNEQVQKQKKLTRCVFWPQCEKGDQCAYLHPNKPCTAFPACQFGQQCHFLHPRCRYDGFCTRLDCPYVHMTKKPMVAAASSTVKMNIPLGDEAPVVEQAMEATTTPTAPVAPPTGKPMAPKITINKIQPIYSLVNKPAALAAEPATESEEKAAVEQPFVKAAKYRHPVYRGNQFSFAHRHPVPINCKFGALCKNLKCPYIHPNAAAQKQSQFKWTASSSQPASAKAESNQPGTAVEETSSQQVIVS